MIGQTLAHYKIVEKIGEGGMGEVYRATDTKLGRDVALKVLPATFAENAERMARFQREAQVLASLNHPNIAAIHGVEETGSQRVLVLELVKGPTILDRLRTGPIAVPEAIDIACQIAEAVEYAHEHGVIHRDLKPANVKVTDDGRVKVLDFGLAKAMAPPTAESGQLSGPDSPTMSPTLSSPITGALTGENVILGTAAYMSPEQARGKPVDRRSDVWSFGVMLFEMLTGQRLFTGETVSDTVAAILKTDPDWSRLPADASPRLRELLERCLSKDPRTRLRDLGDVRLELEWIREGKGEAPGVETAATAGRSFPVAGLVISAVVGVAAGALLWSQLTGAPSPDEAAGSAARLSVVLPEDLAVPNFLLSPDGRTLLAWGRPRTPKSSEEERYAVYLRSLDEYTMRLVPGSRGGAHACFSPDSRWLAVVAPQDAKSTKHFLWKVPVDGSAPPLKLLDWNDTWDGIHWLRNGELVTGGDEGIVRVPADGTPASDPVPLAAGEGIDIEWTVPPRPSSASLLPDGRRLLSGLEAWGDFGYGQNIVALDVQTGEVKLIQENGGSPVWSPTGHLLFSRGTTLLAVPFDPDNLTVTGGPTALTDDLRIEQPWAHGRFDISSDGTLVYQSGGFVAGDRRLVWLDGNLREIEPWSDDLLQIEVGLAVSPDGQRVGAVQSGADGVYDIWMSEPDRPVLRKWIEEPGRDLFLDVWSPDGSWIVYGSRTARDTFYYKRSLPDGTPVLLLEDREAGRLYTPDAVADDGEVLLVTHFVDGTNRIEMLRIAEAEEGRRDPEPLLTEAASAALSPDGRWMAYQSDASGRWELYLRRWLGDGKLGPERRVSTDGILRHRGGSAWWYTPVGGGALELWYRSGQQVHSVTVGAAAGLSRPRVVAEWRSDFFMMAPTPDGRVLMLLRGEDEEPPGEIRVVRGWTGEIRRRLE
ncbi:MAG TPA: protein kinase [bacterium]|nr:protein kinase [bacterium]